MTIDAYAPCPGGTGKKIKFCCPDLQAELDKIHRMLEGEQRAACLELIESLEAKTPDRACLLAMKAMLEAQLGNETKAEETVQRFIEKHPDNPVALAEQATFRATQAEPIVAVNLLQDALEHSPDQVPPALYDALGMVAQSLLVDNQLLAARGHLTLQITLSGAKDQRQAAITAPRRAWRTRRSRALGDHRWHDDFWLWHGLWLRVHGALWRLLA